MSRTISAHARRAVAGLAVGAALLAAPAAGALAATVPQAATPQATVEPTPAPAAGTTWTVEPSGADGPDGRISLRHTVDAGGTVSDQVTLTNYSAAPATFRVYASDGTTTADGGFDLLAPDAEPVDGGSWITVGPVDGATPAQPSGLEVQVAAGASLAVPVSILVPDKATPGDHPAGVVAELVGSGAGAVQLAPRVGVRVHLRVSGDVVAQLRPEDVRASWEPSWNPFSPGTIVVHYDVANDGNVRLGAHAEVAASSGPVEASGGGTADRREVLPGQSVPGEARLSAWPLLLSHVTVSAVPGVVGEDQVDATLAGGSLAVTVWTVPWAQLALLVLLAGGVVLGRRLRRRAAARTQARIDAAVAAATAAAGAEAPGGEEDAGAQAPADVDEVEPAVVAAD